MRRSPDRPGVLNLGSGIRSFERRPLAAMGGRARRGTRALRSALGTVARAVAPRRFVARVEVIAARRTVVAACARESRAPASARVCCCRSTREKASSGR
jgi:hypothetical protein